MGRTGIAASLLVTALFASAAGVSAAGPSGTAPAAAPVKAGPVARLLAKDSGQSVAAVLALKQQDGTWQAVEAALKLQPAEVAAQLAVLRRARVHAAAVVATLARLSGKTPADVRTLKKKGVTWSQVAAQLGLNWQTALPQIRAAFQARQAALLRVRIVVATLARLSGKTPADVRTLKKKGVTWSQVAAQLGLNWQTALGQIRQRVTAATDARIRAAAIVGLLAKLSGKAPAQVRGLKKPGVTWLDVAHSLGIQ